MPARFLYPGLTSDFKPKGGSVHDPGRADDIAQALAYLLVVCWWQAVNGNGEEKVFCTGTSA